jgi:crossover junction endodeoxyribonuclease RusA
MLTVTLPYPISANRYWRTRVIAVPGKPAIVSTYVSTEAKTYKSEVQWLCRAAGIRTPLAGRIAIAYTLYPKRPQDYKTRQRKLGDAWQDTVQCIDLDNAQKVLLDALKGVAFDDDVWVRKIMAERAEPDGDGRIVVTITQIQTQQPQAALSLPEPMSLFDPLNV